MYATSELVGSPGRFYDLLQEASERMPIAKNAGNGSYLAFRSVDGLVFAIDLFAAGFSTVWLDQVRTTIERTGRVLIWMLCLGVLAARYRFSP